MIWRHLWNWTEFCLEKVMSGEQADSFVLTWRKLIGWTLNNKNISPHLITPPSSIWKAPPFHSPSSEPVKKRAARSPRSPLLSTRISFLNHQIIYIETVPYLCDLSSLSVSPPALSANLCFFMWIRHVYNRFKLSLFAHQSV